MSRALALPVLMLVVAMTATESRAQDRTSDRLLLDAVAFAGPEQRAARVDLFIAVPYGMVTFDRAGDRFVASYRVHIEITSDRRRVFDSSFAHTTSTQDFAVVSAQRSGLDLFQEHIALPPGEYEAVVGVSDGRTSFVTTARRTFRVADYAGAPLALSGILLVDKIREDGGGFVITPRIGETVGSDDDFFAFFEAYNAGAPLAARVDALFRDRDGRIAAVRNVERTIPAQRSQQWVALDAAELPRGEYTLELRAYAPADTTRVLATTSRPITIEPAETGMPGSEDELDERIAQLRYVAAQSEIDSMREAPTHQEKVRRYAAFWKRLDPTPGTVENEAMNEYFSRIEYARDHFRSYTAGWLTDQGRIYVVYGPPDNVSRDPFRSDGRRIETWQYYSHGNLQVVFEDDTGFGDYRLVSPVGTFEKFRYGG
jgi:GWxTD domain-containing protein